MHYFANLVNKYPADTPNNYSINTFQTPPGFDVTVVPTENMGGREFRQTMLDFSYEKHGDIMVLVVMSHGEEGGHSGKVLTSKNGERIDIEHDIFQYV